MTVASSAIQGLPPVMRLALAYAPSGSRKATLALLALDTRLAEIVRRSHEPMLAQLRLAWWRDQLSAPASAWPAGEPVLACLRAWNGAHPPLVALVDGWEAMTGDAPLDADDLARLPAARGAAFAALAMAVGCEAAAAEALRTGREWALADMAARLSDQREREVLAALLRAESWARARLPRALRPLAVLHGLARRPVAATRAGTLATALRIGLLGR